MTVFHRILSDSKSARVFRTFLSILADVNNAVVWRVSNRPVISKSSSPCTDPFVTVSIIIGIIVTFMFHILFFNSPERSRYLSLFFYSLNFTLWLTGTAKSKILQVLYFWLIIIRSDRLVEIRWSDFILPPRGDRACHSPSHILGCAYTNCSNSQTSISCIISSGSPCPPSHASAYTLFVLIDCIRLLCDLSFRLYHHIAYICYFAASYPRFDMVSPYGVVLCWYSKGFSFSLKVSLP